MAKAQGRKKPKRNRASDPNRSMTMDQCQTPPYAVEPLIPYLNPKWVIWESAAGEGLMVQAFRDRGFTVIGTDILTGQNFFKIAPPFGVDVQVTNPPYSAKYRWIEHSYQLGITFALLVPGDVLFAGAAHEYFMRYGFEMLVFEGGTRVDFKMPEKGWYGGGAQFATVWLTWGLNIGQQITFVDLPKPNKQRRDEMAQGIKQLSLIEGTR